MNTIYRLAKSELNQLFFSPVAWLILIIFAFQTGMIFSDIFDGQLRAQDLGNGLYGVTGDLYLGYNGFLIKMVRNLYLYIPLLTMGLMSREYSSGSIKLLYSSPITNVQIILGKYAAMLVYGLLLIAIWLIYIIFGMFTIEQMDVPLVLSAILGLYLLICAYAAIGLFMSCLTSYQVVAAMGTLAVLAFLNYVGQIGQNFDFIRDITYWLSISGRVYTFLEGMIASEDVIYFLIVIVLFVLLSVIKLGGERTRRSVGETVLRYGGVVVCGLLIGYTTTLPRMKFYADVTATKTNTLTPNSQNIIRQLDGGMTITTYVNLLEENYYTGLPAHRNDDIKRFENYLRYKPEIKMKYVYYYDQVKNEYLESRYPGLTDLEKAQKICRANKLNFKMFLPPEEIRKQIDLSAEKNRFVRIVERENGQKAFLRVYDDMQKHPSETEITAALKRFLVQGPKVAFLSGHGERDLESTGDRFYNQFSKSVYFRHSLINQGFDVCTLSLDTEEIPEDINLLVIADPRKALSEVELGSLQRYIDKGGDLFILGEPHRENILNPITASLGVEFMPGMLVQDNGEDYAPTVIVGDITDEAVELMPTLTRIKNWRYGFAMPTATGLKYSPVNGFKVAPIAVTRTKGSWNELETTDFTDEKPVLNREIGEQEQSYPVILALEREVKNKKQRILIAGDADCISNGELNKQRNGIRASNFSLITSAFRWFSDNEYPIDTSRPDLPDKSISLKRSDMVYIRTVALWVIPGILLLLGIVIGVRRRGK